MAASLHILYDGLGPASRRAEGDARVDLAAEQDFMIAALKVSPSTREVFDGGARDVLEPRVMMVLVALARADGATVSRDKLIQSCWDGLAVSDDAINRVIGRLRRLAASSGAFSIETITKVGYRLHADPRFLALLTRIGLVDYWRTSGTRPDLCDRIPDQCSVAGLPQRQPGQVPGSAS